MDEKPMHFGDDDKTLCGKRSGMVYMYTSGRPADVTCLECCAELNAKEPKNYRVVTFGADHKHPITGESLRNCYVKIPSADPDIARAIALMIFGREFCTDYPAHLMRIRQRHLREIELPKLRLIEPGQRGWDRLDIQTQRWIGLVIARAIMDWNMSDLN